MLFADATASSELNRVSRVDSPLASSAIGRGQKSTLFVASPCGRWDCGLSNVRYATLASFPQIIFISTLFYPASSICTVCVPFFAPNERKEDPNHLA